MAVVAEAAPQLGMLKGFYNESSATQASSVSHCRALLSQAAEQVPIPFNQALHIGEWGCAHGGNSIMPVHSICRSLNQRVLAGSSRDKQQLQVHITHTDVASNSWTELFQCAKQYQERIEEELPNLRITFAGVGSSQYVRNHPSRTLDLGFTFNAMHWLSKRPCQLKHAMSTFSGKVLPEELCKLTHQASEDLEHFLNLRADEFKPGGLLVMSFGILTEETRRLELFSDPQAVADQMVAEGLWREEELGRLAPPVFFLDEPAQQQVFSKVSDEWELLHFDVVMATNPQVEQMVKDGADSKLRGQTFTWQVMANFMKAALYTFMEAGLLAAGRSKETVDSLMDTFFSRLAQCLGASPKPVGFYTNRVLLKRRS